MKIITKSTGLESKFIELINNYSNYYWTTAWGSSKSKPFKKLLDKKENIKQVVVGIHFYQTDPDFIEEFLDVKKVRYVMQPQGVFHPKLFLFYNNENDWQLLIGSANFTKGAFTINTEVSTLINQNDINATETLSEVKDFINSTWDNAELFNREKLDSYKTAWKNLKSKRESLSGNYGNEKNSENRPIYLDPIIKMDWKSFVEKIKKSNNHTIEDRLKVLNIARAIFDKNEYFSNLSLNERKYISGLRSDINIETDSNCAYFGSMVGSGKFQNRIKENDKLISKAIYQIPLNGQITKSHFDNFIRYFSQSLEGNFLGTATRLLAMKRPDIFVCLSSRNKKLLCKDFGISANSLDYESYWNKIILRIKDSEWWLNSTPKNDIERNIYKGRVAMLDALYYEE